jgi:serine/threonine protein kinase
MVHAAQRKDTGKLYAVKCMDKRLIKARHATRMIVTERDVLASVDSPFVAGLQSAWQDEREVFFSLELKTGGDLEHYLLHMGRRFTEGEVRFMAAEILLGLKVRVGGDHRC